MAGRTHGGCQRVRKKPENSSAREAVSVEPRLRVAVYGSGSGNVEAGVNARNGAGAV